MCGIAGFIDFNRKSSRDILQQCTDTLIHRGPDGSGYEFFETDTAQVGLGHRRLSIIDLSEAGHQPMAYQHLTISYNGEVYNFAEIKTTLEQAGHRFNSHSDTEVILHAYAEWGTGMLQHFIGMFAMVIYDHEKQELLCIRDRAGAKPFYYYFNEGLFLFASELKAFHRHPGFKKEISRPGLSQYFRQGYISAPNTIFTHCAKLRPGHIMQVDLKRRSLLETSYWKVEDAYRQPILDISEQEAKTRLQAILQSAFRYRMVADVPVGIFLSGGYDSSLVTAMLQRESATPLHTFTIGFREAAYNEATEARKIAEHLGTHHTEYFCTRQEALDIIPELPWIYDEPMMDNSAIPTILVSRLARRQVTVALSSDAGDEIFAGYTTYDHLLGFQQRLGHWPLPLRRQLASIMRAFPFAQLPGTHGRIIGRYHKFAALLDSENLVQANENINAMLEPVWLNKLLDGNYFPLPATPKKGIQGLNALLAHDYLNYMCDDVLVKVDRAGMCTSLEGREPFLDHRIVEFAAQLPEALKYRKGIKKYLLREITHDLLPKEMMDRPKQGFSVPIDAWLRHELRDLVDEYLAPDRLRAHGLLDVDTVQQFRRLFAQGKLANRQLIWQLLVFQLWAEKWM